MRSWRPQHIAPGLAGMVDVVGVAALPGEQTRILEAGQRSADAPCHTGDRVRLYRLVARGDLHGGSESADDRVGHHQCSSWLTQKPSGLEASLQSGCASLS